MKMDRVLFLQMMGFFRLPADDVAKLLHPGEFQQLKWRAVVHNKSKRSRGTIVGYASPAAEAVRQ